MKRLPLGAALAALMLTTSSFVMANNAFSDVTPDDWSYKAVSQLTKASLTAIRMEPLKEIKILPVMKWDRL